MKKPIKLALLTVGLVILLTVSIPFAYVSYDDYSVRRHGEALAKRIDAFELKEGHVPKTLQEIGEKYPYNADRLAYYASDAHHYTIRYMDWASATYVFNSTSREWEFRRT
jgi:hypothetical protein